MRRHGGGGERLVAVTNGFADEAMLARRATQALRVVGSHAAGAREVGTHGVEAGGEGVATGRHAAPLTANAPRGVLHGNRTYLMSDEGGQVADTQSISAGLDYPGVGPEHALWKDVGRVRYVAADDNEVLAAFRELTLVEGIMPALESSHALAHAKKLAGEMSPEQHIVVNLSGRGDKDIHTVAKLDGIAGLKESWILWQEIDVNTILEGLHP